MDPTDFFDSDTSDDLTDDSDDDTGSASSSALGNISPTQIAEALGGAAALAGGVSAVKGVIASIKGTTDNTVPNQAPVSIIQQAPSSSLSASLASMSTAEKLVIVIGLGALALMALHIVKMPKG